jgi:hypothetical protein
LRPERDYLFTPGRFCPSHYRYAPEAIGCSPAIEAETLFVVGGLYGNRPALDAILELAAEEPRPVTLVFNGDFNWFNVDRSGFEGINSRVLRHVALRGNVETELAKDDAAAGCGCVYPESVSDAEVARSNSIEERLRQTARGFPALRAQLDALPMYNVARVRGVRIGIVHGDAEALAGWGFARGALDDPMRRTWIESCFARAGVHIFASSHTCLPACRTFATTRGECAIVNNGSAGMPNFSGTAHGIVTRIAPAASPRALYGTSIEGVRVEALPVAYDQAEWLEEFLHNWPPGSPAHLSYWDRLVGGLAGTLSDAMLPLRTGQTRKRQPAAQAS